MNCFKVLLLGLLFATACSSEPPKQKAQAPAVPDVTFLSGALLITGDGSEPIEEAAMIIENGKISQIGKKGELHPPEGAARVNLEGRTVMPTLVNLHAHPGLLDGMKFSAKNYNQNSVLADLNRYAFYGVGAVLALGTDSGDVPYQLRDDQRQGKTGDAARYFTAGRGITAKGGWPTQIPTLENTPYQISNQEEARKAVSELADKKVDIVKIWVDDLMNKAPKIKPEVYRTVIEEAHKHNLRAFAHVFYLADAQELVRSKIDGFVHSVRDREVDDGLINAMKEKNIFLVPTLTAHETGFIYADKPAWLDEKSMLEAYPVELVAELRSAAFVNTFKNNPDLPKLRQQYAIAQKNLKKMAAAGVTIGFGTDSGTANRFIGYFEHRELELMVAAGLSPAQAITAATKTSAEILGLKDLGILAVGKTADFVVLSGNPLENIKNTLEIAAIYRNGKEVNRGALKTKFTAESHQ